MLKRTIREYKRELKLLFSDPFVVKKDHTNRVISRATQIRKKLEIRLWSK